MEGRLWTIRAQSHIHSVVRHFFNIPASMQAIKRLVSNCLITETSQIVIGQALTILLSLLFHRTEKVACLFVHEGFLDGETWIRYPFLYHLFKIKFIFFRCKSCRSRQNQTRAWKQTKAVIKSKSAQLCYLQVKGSITYFLVTKDGLRTTLDKRFFNV